MSSELDAIVVGAGPNGLAAAIELARHDLNVLVIEAADTVGGGMRTVELTRPGFLHDECSAIHPLGILSPYFKQLPLDEHGLHWVPFAASVAHPLDDEPAAMLYRSFDETAATIGPDGDRWRRLFEPFIEHADDLIADVMGPPSLARRRPIQLARFGIKALRTADGFARGAFEGDRARALFAGCAAHAILPLDFLTTAALGLIFSITAHVTEWPCARGGSQRIAEAMASYFQSLGGRIELGRRITTPSELAESRVVLLDLTPRPIVQLLHAELPHGYCRRLLKYRYGPGTFKLDWALSEAIPWNDPAVAGASTVHVGGALQEIAVSESDAWHGRHTEKPYLICCQQSNADNTRAPAGHHTGYAYCHVPGGSDIDMTEHIERQIERFAPGFRDCIIDRHATSPAGFEALNPNYVGGAVTGGAADIRQLFTRPVAQLRPYETPHPRYFICSSSTPPGGGVHGMCGYHAAQAVLRRLGS